MAWWTFPVRCRCGPSSLSGPHSDTGLPFPLVNVAALLSLVDFSTGIAICSPGSRCCWGGGGGLGWWGHWARLHDGRCMPYCTALSCKASHSPLLGLGHSLLLPGGVYRRLHCLWCCRGPRHGCNADLRVARFLRVVFCNRRVGEGAVRGLGHTSRQVCIVCSVDCSSLQHRRSAGHCRFLGGITGRRWGSSRSL